MVKHHFSGKWVLPTFLLRLTLVLRRQSLMDKTLLLAPSPAMPNFCTLLLHWGQASRKVLVRICTWTTAIALSGLSLSKSVNSHLSMAEFVKINYTAGIARRWGRWWKFFYEPSESPPNALWLNCNGEVVMINFHFWHKTLTFTF